LDQQQAWESRLRPADEVLWAALEPLTARSLFWVIPSALVDLMLARD